MGVLKVIKNRFSVRKFKDQPIEPEKLERILEAAKAAPTAKCTDGKESSAAAYFCLQEQGGTGRYRFCNQVQIRRTDRSGGMLRSERSVAQSV